MSSSLSRLIGAPTSATPLTLLITSPTSVRPLTSPPSSFSAKPITPRSKGTLFTLCSPVERTNLALLLPAIGDAARTSLTQSSAPSSFIHPSLPSSSMAVSQSSSSFKKPNPLSSNYSDSLSSKYSRLKITIPPTPKSFDSDSLSSKYSRLKITIPPTPKSFDNELSTPEEPSPSFLTQCLLSSPKYIHSGKREARSNERISDEGAWSVISPPAIPRSMKALEEEKEFAIVRARISPSLNKPTDFSTRASKLDLEGSKMPLISADLLDTVLDWTCLEDYETIDKRTFTNYLAEKINHFIRNCQTSMFGYQEISPCPEITGPTSYQSWVKIKNGKIHLKLQKVGALIFAKGATKQLRSLHAISFNPITQETGFIPQVSITFDAKINKNDFKDFENGRNLQRMLLSKYPSLSIAPPSKELLRIKDGEGWRKSIWYDTRYDCELAYALKTNAILCLDNETLIPFTLIDFVKSMISITATLVIMHDFEGIVHKDLKPQNILLTVDLNNMVKAILIDLSLGGPIGKYWVPSRPCSYWDELANNCFTSPLTDCFSFSLFLIKCFFPSFTGEESDAREKFLATGELSKVPFNLCHTYFKKFEAIDKKEATLFQSNPENYLRSKLWQKKLATFSKVESPPNFHQFITTIKTFLNFIRELEILLEFKNLIINVNQSVMTFNKMVKSGLPDAIIDREAFGNRIKEVYKNYTGFKMAHIFNTFVRLDNFYNEAQINWRREVEKFIHPTLRTKLYAL